MKSAVVGSGPYLYRASARADSKARRGRLSCGLHGGAGIAGIDAADETRKHKARGGGRCVHGPEPSAQTSDTQRETRNVRGYREKKIVQSWKRTTNNDPTIFGTYSLPSSLTATKRKWSLALCANDSTEY